jgi:hypothetical protein
MRNMKALTLALIAVFAFGAVVASAAQAGAPRWTEEGTTLGAGVEKTVTGEVTGSWTFVAFGIHITATLCTNPGKIIGSTAGSPGTFKGTMHCSGAIVPGAPKCIVKSEGATTNGTILSTPLSGRLVWLAQRPNITSVGLTLEPEPVTSTAIAHIEVTGVGCAAANKFTITGNVICTASPVSEDAVNGTLDCPSSPIKKYFTNQTPTRTEDEDTGLKVGAGAGTLTAHFVNIKVASGLKWGIENG